MTAVPIEERIALQDLMLDYCYAVDKLARDEVVQVFTDDAVLDLSGVGLPVMPGKPSIAAYYETMLGNTSDTTHYISNFRVESYGGDTATIYAYVEGLGRLKDGNEIHGHTRWRMACVKQDGAWKCSKFWLLPGMPLPGPLDQILASGLR